MKDVETKRTVKETTPASSSTILLSRNKLGKLHIIFLCRIVSCEFSRSIGTFGNLPREAENYTCQNSFLSVNPGLSFLWGRRFE